jgi:hypothetical protein
MRYLPGHISLLAASESGLLYDANYIQQDNSANGGCNDGAYQAARAQAQQAEQKATEHSANDSHNNIADDAKTFPFHYVSGKPSSYCANGQKNYQAGDIHDSSRFSS